MSGWGGGSVDFVDFVTLDRSLAAGLCCSGPGYGKAGIAGLERVSRLAAHARSSGGEGNRPARREGDDEGDSLIGRPFTEAGRAAGAG